MIGPVIAKKKAEEMGIEIPEEGGADEGGDAGADEGGKWGSGAKKGIRFRKLATDIQKNGLTQNMIKKLAMSLTDDIMGGMKVTAETVEEREKEREDRRKEHEKEQQHKNFDVKPNPKMKPPRNDLRNNGFENFKLSNRGDVIVGATNMEKSAKIYRERIFELTNNFHTAKLAVSFETMLLRERNTDDDIKRLVFDYVPRLLIGKCCLDIEDLGTRLEEIKKKHVDMIDGMYGRIKAVLTTKTNWQNKTNSIRQFVVEMLS